MVHPKVRSALQVLLTNVEPFKESGVGFSEFIANAINLYEPDLLPMVGPMSREDHWEVFVWAVHRREVDPVGDYDVLCPVQAGGYYCDYVAGHDYGHSPGNRTMFQSVPEGWEPG